MSYKGTKIKRSYPISKIPFNKAIEVEEIETNRLLCYTPTGKVAEYTSTGTFVGFVGVSYSNITKPCKAESSDIGDQVDVVIEGTIVVPLDTIPDVPDLGADVYIVEADGLVSLTPPGDTTDTICGKIIKFTYDDLENITDIVYVQLTNTAINT